MGYSFIPTAITTGARRYYTLAGDGARRLNNAAGIPINMNHGLRRNYTLGGTLGGLGSVPDANTLSELQDNGWDPSRLNILVQLGATNEQLLNLPYPASEDEMTSAYNALALQLSNQPPATTSAPAGTTPAPAPASTPAPAVPAGSVVQYTGTFTPTSNVFSPSFYSIDSVVAAIAQNLQNTWHLSVIGQQSSGGVIGTPTISLTLQTAVAYAQLSDLKSIIDGAFYNAAGAKVTSSQIQISRMGSGTPSPAAAIGAPSFFAPATISNVGSWLQQNLGTLVFAFAAIAILPPLIRKL